MTQVAYNDLDLAISMVSNPIEETLGFISRTTGDIWYQSEQEDILEDQLPLPDNLDDKQQYLVILNQDELSLGKELVFHFAEDIAPHVKEDIKGIFSRKGAFRRFRNFLGNHNLLNQWYDFKDTETRKIITQWMTNEGFEVI